MIAIAKSCHSARPDAVNAAATALSVFKRASLSRTRKHCAQLTMPPKSTKPAVPKTIIAKVLCAIETLASPAPGSSRQAIAKFLKDTYDTDNAAALKRALTKGVTDGVLVQQGQSFSIPGMEFEAAEDEKVTIEVLREGYEDSPRSERGDQVDVSYVGTLAATGEEFERTRVFTFNLGLGEVIKGFDQGMTGMKVNEKRRLTIPPKLGYGKRGSPPDIPGDATLIFEVVMLRFMPMN